MSVITDASRESEPPVPPTPSRIDYSVGTEMVEAVKVYDMIMLQWKKGTLDKEWDGIMHGGKPSKTKFAKYAGINPKTFQKYVLGGAK